MKRFYLTGHRTFGNRGCEAIVRSTVSMLNQTFGSVEVLVPSDDIARDSRQWPQAEQYGVQFVEAYMPRLSRYWIHAQRLPLRTLKQAGWPFPLKAHLYEQLKSVDAVLSVGGDNYSLDYRLPSLQVGIDQFAINLGKPTYLWGASVGPFEAEPHFVPIIKKHLSNMTKIFVRESISYEYLTQTLGLSNVTQMADPAFTLSKDAVDVSSFWPKHGVNGTIGFNLSPLIESYTKEGQDLRAEAIKFIRGAVGDGYAVMLIPHVIPLDGTESGNDYIYMSKMLKQLEDLGNSVSLMPAQLNASQIKQVISQLRFFIGARTHATIAALSSGIPTISISYSVKAKGINKDLLGDMPIVLPTPKLTTALLNESLQYLISNEAQIKSALDEKLPLWRDRASQAANSLKLGIEKDD